MKAIALVTMIFLPGTFVAVSRQRSPHNVITKLICVVSSHFLQCHCLTGKRQKMDLLYRTASGFTGR